MTPGITHLGAKECVTGSCHLVQTRPGAGNSVNILVNCGMAQGYDPQLLFEQFPVPPEKIHYLFLTHAHPAGPGPPESCDLLILESTYGDRNHNFVWESCLWRT